MNSNTPSRQTISNGLRSEKSWPRKILVVMLLTRSAVPISFREKDGDGKAGGLLDVYKGLRVIIDVARRVL